MPKQGETSPAGPKKRPVTPRRSAGSRLIEQRGLIIGAIEAGSTDHVVAQGVAGISPRTFRELRQRAEGRHPTRRATQELTKFFAEVDKAAARATMKQEIVVAGTDPKHWLKYKARSKPGLEGWTEPVPEESEAQDPIHVMSADELQQIVSTLLVSGAVEVPPCPDPSCTCSYHGARGEEGEADEAL